MKKLIKAATIKVNYENISKDLDSILPKSKNTEFCIYNYQVEERVYI